MKILNYSLGLMVAIILAISVSCTKQGSTSGDDAQFVEDIISKMSIEDKVAFIGGVNMFYIRGFEEYGIPEVKLTDGPVGVNKCGKSTAYPSTMCLSSSWNTDLVESVGRAMGQEAKSKGVDVMLCPGMNIYRSPLCGRNFEYLGEDPLLVGKIASSFIIGMQSEGIIATAKHFVANNQEFDRNNTSSDLDERTLREIYLPAFKMSVQEAKVATVMDGYNLVNGVHCTEHAYLNNEVLKEEWGFDGFIMSDWNACYDGLACALGGLDLEMPYGKFMHPDTLLPAIKNGQLDEAVIDDKVRRILSVYKRFDLFDKAEDTYEVNLNEVSEIAINQAREGFVLLRNENGVLPIDRETVNSIAVVGPNSHPAMISGGGSARVDPLNTVSYYEAISNLAGDQAEVFLNETYTNTESDAYYEKSNFYTKDIGDPTKEVKGLRAEYFKNEELKGEPYAVRIDPYVNYNFMDSVVGDMDIDHFSVRWTGKLRVERKDTYTFYMRSDDGCRLYIDGVLQFENWDRKITNYMAEGNAIVLEAGDHDIKFEYYEDWGTAIVKMGYNTTEQIDTYRKSIIELSQKSEVAVVCVGFNTKTETEGRDRPYGLSQEQLDIIDDVASVNDHVVIVLNSGGNADINAWHRKGQAIIHSWYAGQEGAVALGEILFGITNPSGRLPISIEKKLEDLATYSSYSDDDGDKRVEYTEGVFIGYRHHDTKNIAPLYPFGFGLSYTTFDYSDLSLSKAEFSSEDKIEVTASIKNTGEVAGAEVVQLYVSDPESSVARPVKELKAFDKVYLEAGESRTVKFELDKSAFSFYNVEKKAWDLESGDFEILIGSSSMDIRLRQIISAVD